MNYPYKKTFLAAILVVIVGTIVWLEAIKPRQGPTITAQQAALAATSTTTAGGANSGAVESAASGTTTVADNQNSAPTSAGSLTPAQFLASRASTIRQESTQYQAAAEITDPTGWINTQPFTLASLIGKKVVLLDFWTYSCINCLRTIPYLNAWYQKYKDAGLVIVGIHTPEFNFEHDYANVAAAVKSLGIQYPVVLDNNQGTWNAYQNLYWPNEYLINIDGFVVHNNIGEGNYNETESAIQAALTQRDEALGIPTSTIPTGMSAPENAIAINYHAVQSPETYFGAARNGYLANGPAMTNGVYTLSIPSSTPQSNALYLSGQWNFQDEYATNETPGAKIIYSYNAMNVYMVASAAAPVTAHVLVDGQPIPAAMAGSDVSPAGTITIQANRLYNIIHGTSYGAHTIELIIQQPGLEAYTFTFG